jgi:RNA binding exosome subunit
MIHNIRFRLFIYENENQDQLILALHNILPTAEFEVEIAEGLLGEPMQILTGRVDKKRDCKDFLNKLLELDNNQLIKLSNDLDRKMDYNGNLFLRFDKYDAIDDVWNIIDKGDAIHLKVKIVAYPAKKEIAMKNFREILP